MMKRFAMYLILACATFGIGAAIPKVWLAFDLTFLASGVTGNGGGFGARGYKSSDGYKLVYASGGHGSPETAQDEMQRFVEVNAIEIVEARTEFDKANMPIGKRVTMLVSPDEDGMRVIVVWTEGEGLRYILAPSIRHATALEKYVSNGGY